MYASNLEGFLFEFVAQSDIGKATRTDISKRFQTLRSYGRLPSGRANQASQLSTTEIAAAILGLAPTNPDWAGHCATVLRIDLPSPTPQGAFSGVRNLSEVIERLIEDKAARSSLLYLSLSAAEIGPGSACFATLVYHHSDEVSFIAFGNGLSVQQSDSDKTATVPPVPAYSAISRSINLTSALFDSLALRIEREGFFPAPLQSDGSEYDEEEKAAALHKKLGVKPGAKYLNIGVDTQVTWPSKITPIKFEQHDLVLMPKTEKHTQSIHIDLQSNQVTMQQAHTIINRFLSLMTWCDDSYALSQGGWSGNPIPVAVPKRNLAFATAHSWVFDRKIPATKQAQKAIALYREGRNSEENGQVSYAVLSYFKIIELKLQDAPKVKDWITANFTLVTEPLADSQMQFFLDDLSGREPGKHINKAYRVAVAHASNTSPSDPDDAQESIRLYSAAYVLRHLARHMIKSTWYISESIYSGD
jgi:hypothetical protein